MIEHWVDIAGYNGVYQVSNIGRIKSFQKGERILSQSVGKTGYKVISLSMNGKINMIKVHRIVLSAFVENTENKPFVNHKDSNRLNNTVENLEWCTQKENMVHASSLGRLKLENRVIRTPKNLRKYKGGSHLKGRTNNWTSKKVSQYDLNNNFIKEWPSLSEIQRSGLSTIRKVYASCRGKIKTHKQYIWKYS